MELYWKKALDLNKKVGTMLRDVAASGELGDRDH